MRIICRCGHTISDSTDCLPDKAHLLADQDLYALYDEHEDPAARFEAVRELMRCIYQCFACGRLCIDVGDRGLLWFMPEEGRHEHTLGSVLGRRYKVSLRANWASNPPVGPMGYVFWGSAGDLAGGFEDCASPEAVEARYAEIKRELMVEGRLRDALLRVDGVDKDRWRSRPADTSIAPTS